jgi:hypothetical protein
MWQAEVGEDRYNLALFAFYEACWPFLWCARTCGLVKNEEINAIPRRRGFHHMTEGDAYNGLVQTEYTRDPYAFFTQFYQTGSKTDGGDETTT